MPRVFWSVLNMKNRLEVANKYFNKHNKLTEQETSRDIVSLYFHLSFFKFLIDNLLLPGDGAIDTHSERQASTSKVDVTQFEAVAAADPGGPKEYWRIHGMFNCITASILNS